MVVDNIQIINRIVDGIPENVRIKLFFDIRVAVSTPTLTCAPGAHPREGAPNRHSPLGTSEAARHAVAKA